MRTLTLSTLLTIALGSLLTGCGAGTSGSDGGSSYTCCVNGTNYSCNTAADAESCSGSCTSTGTNASGKCN
jgi:hypothetical protein